MDLQVDEAEHSMEMHLPYLAKVFEGYPVKVVPILVGALNVENEAIYGQLLAKYVDDPNNFFSVSSDFCHWGSRFNYMHYDKKHGAIHKSIEALDKMGMDIIETGDPDAFKQYLLDTDNTICGHHPISVFLHAVTSPNPRTSGESLPKIHAENRPFKPLPSITISSLSCSHQPPGFWVCLDLLMRVGLWNLFMADWTLYMKLLEDSGVP